MNTSCQLVITVIIVGSMNFKGNREKRDRKKIVQPGGSVVQKVRETTVQSIVFRSDDHTAVHSGQRAV